MKDFLIFRRMLMPIIMLIVFWLGVALCIGTSIYDFFKHEIANGFIVLILGPIVVRIICEVFILFFRMNETLTDIKQALTKLSHKNESQN